MALLENHLEQISLSAAAIAELPFPPPKKFTNALLRSQDITALIRDTEAHERALFKFAPLDPTSAPAFSSIPQRSTIFGSRSEDEHFLKGTNPIPSAKERISALRSRFDQLTSSITRYEARTSIQTSRLAKMNRRGPPNEDDDVFSSGRAGDEACEDKSNEIPINAGDLEREEQEIRELERKKRTLEDRVSGMERDLGGLLR
ncbi:MAG: hypothetical protein Q9201_002931 [Fulgogasparrea decipioides]